MRRLSLLLVVSFAACDSPPKAASVPPPPPAGPATAAPATASTAPATGAVEGATFAAVLKVDLKACTKTASGLYYRDLTVGTGPVVAIGRQVSVHYAGWHADGKSFDQSGPNDAPFSFTPGAGEVIKGWDEGVVGMQTGGKRQLIIPPTLGYGAEGRGPIPPNAVLVFTVDVVSAK